MLFREQPPCLWVASSGLKGNLIEAAFITPFSFISPFPPPKNDRSSGPSPQKKDTHLPTAKYIANNLEGFISVPKSTKRSSIWIYLIMVKLPLYLILLTILQSTSTYIPRKIPEFKHLWVLSPA